MIFFDFCAERGSLKERTKSETRMAFFMTGNFYSYLKYVSFAGGSSAEIVVVKMRRQPIFNGLFHKSSRLLISNKDSLSIAISSRFVSYPTLPSKLISSSFWASTANSIGSLFSTSLLKPFTIKAMAFSVSIPLWLQ